MSSFSAAAPPRQSRHAAPNQAGQQPAVVHPRRARSLPAAQANDDSFSPSSPAGRLSHPKRAASAAAGAERAARPLQPSSGTPRASSSTGISSALPAPLCSVGSSFTASPCLEHPPQICFDKIFQCFRDFYAQETRASSHENLSVLQRFEQQMAAVSQAVTTHLSGVEDFAERAKLFTTYIGKMGLNASTAQFFDEFDKLHQLVVTQINRRPEIVELALTSFPPTEMFCIEGTRERLRAAIRTLHPPLLGMQLMDFAIEELATRSKIRACVPPGSQIHTQAALRFIAGLSSRECALADEYFRTVMGFFDAQEVLRLQRELPQKTAEIFTGLWKELVDATNQMQRTTVPGIDAAEQECQGWLAAKKNLEMNTLFEQFARASEKTVADFYADDDNFDAHACLQQVHQWIAGAYGGDASRTAPSKPLPPTLTLAAMYSEPQTAARILREQFFQGHPQAIATVFCLAENFGGASPYLANLILSPAVDFDAMLNGATLLSGTDTNRLLAIKERMAHIIPTIDGLENLLRLMQNLGPALAPVSLSEPLQIMISLRYPLCEFEKLLARMADFYHDGEPISRLDALLHHPQAADIVKLLASHQRVLHDPEFLATIVHLGRTELVRQLLDAGASPFIRDQSGWTLLHMAANAGHAEIVRILLKKIKDVDAVDLRGLTPLHLALKHGHQEIVGMLLEMGAHPNRADQAGLRPLHQAATHGNQEIVEELLARGATVDAPDPQGLTALHVAVRHGHIQVVKALLAAGATPFTSDALGSTPLHCAAHRGHATIARLLLDSHAPIDRQDICGETPLHAAATHGHHEMVALLLERGAEVRAVNQHGFTPLDLATQSKHQEIIWTLRAAAADPVLTPLHEAAYRGDRAALVQLLNSGGDVNEPALRGFTPLHLAALRGHGEAITALLAQGAAVNQTSLNGLTPLHLAAHQGHHSIVTQLLQQRADVSKADHQGFTPLHLAAKEGHRAVVMALLQSGAVMGQRSREGFTALHTAVYNRQREMALLLVANGANVDQPDVHGVTPRQLAHTQGWRLPA